MCQTDRQMDARGKTICPPTLNGGDIIILSTKADRQRDKQNTIDRALPTFLGSALTNPLMPVGISCPYLLDKSISFF